MKVIIGPYNNWFGPYQLAELLCFWAKKVKDEHGLLDKPQWVHNFGEWLSEKQDGTPTLLHKFLLWVDRKKTRQIYVKIDPWDTWSMDHTLSHIVVPMLKQLQATKHGAPMVDDEDVPDELKSTSAPPKKDAYDIDDNHFKRWDYVMDEMIFAFEHRLDDSWQDEFRSGNIDFVSKPVDVNGNEVPKKEAKYFEMVDGPKHTYKCDYDGIRKVEERIQNGFRLFGKYYSGLWD